MGLRINTNASSLNALRNLHLSDRAQSRSLERLASGLRINRGADDPSGLVISERLRGQISALQQSAENSQNAGNLISTADTALQKVSDLLIEVQDSIQFALNTGGASPDQIAAEQDSVDQALAAIDRIAATTRYGDRGLLNGSTEYQLGASIGNMVTFAGGAGGTMTAFQDVHFRSVSFAAGSTSRVLSIQAIVNPQRAEIQMGGAISVTGSPATIRVTGARGAADIILGVGSTGVEVAAAVNAASQQTGVFAQVGVAGGVILRSEGFGVGEFMSVQGISGTLTTGAVTTRDDAGALVAVAASPSVSAGEVISDRGLDARALFNGIEYTAKGLEFSVNTADVSFSFSMNPDLYHPNQVAALGGLPGVNTAVVASRTATMTVARTGLEFQLREGTTVSDRLALGIEGVSTAALGFEQHRDVIAEASVNSFATALSRGGFLSSVRSGQGNDLTQNAANALTIVNSAAAQVAGIRGFIGAVVSFNVEPNLDSIEVAVENLSASMSAIRDLDFAEETANFTRTQILFQSGIAALASARLVPQAILQLLG